VIGRFEGCRARRLSAIFEASNVYLLSWLQYFICGTSE
jgi:hypothetical protein